MLGCVRTVHAQMGGRVALRRAGKHEGTAGVTAGVQTPATLVVGASKATLNRNALSGSNLRVLRV